MNDSFPLPPDVLDALAPLDLVNFRATRYLGDDISMSLDAFTPPDQMRLRKLYQTLQELLAIVRPQLDTPEIGVSQLRSFIKRVGWIGVVRETQLLGDSQESASPNQTFGKVIHDIRGGALQALSIQLQFIDLDIAQNGDLHRLFFLTRDHLKIMRNAVVDLDPEGYERDRRDNLHNVRLLTEKWQHATHNVQGNAAQVHVDTYFDGNVSERCLEFAALDRVLYNLMNNAVRNTGDGNVYLAIMPFPQGEPHNLRFVIYNAIQPEQRNLLRSRYGEQLGTLFQGGFTTGGTGLGMRICADFVTNAFGLRTVQEGLSGRYFGANLAGDYFVNWFHWPIAAD